MKKLKGHEIRKMWLQFFKGKGHQVIPSAPLIPINDPTLLWINAGIAPLKKYFDGREVPQNKRMVNAQKSIRTNDIENVGKTARHHTFFEMLGNFSVGDYFRDEALTWAYEILTSNDWFAFDINKLYFTIYPDDEESFNKWISLGVKEDHIVKLEGNFWEIGEGPCGPDTEIFYDRGPKYDPQNLGIKLLTDEIENDRYIEIWNIVFSQYNAVDGVPRSEYKELPSKNIDTGMGLERMACVMQEVDTNYDTDLFMPIIAEVENLTNVKYIGQMAFKVIADHVRSVTFAVSDGAVLSNEGRGYVLRRILRRAVRYGKKLGMNEPFLYKLVKVVSNYMSDYYPYLLETCDDVSRIVKQEEEKFLTTLESGEKRLVDYINNATDKIIPGDIAFLLYDTFGFPFELTLEVSDEFGFKVDEKGFIDQLQKQKERARSSRNDDQSMNAQNEDMINFKKESIFVGYKELDTIANVIGIFKDGYKVEKADGDVLVVFDKTPFYAESGGQVGDIGRLVFNKKEYLVTNTTKLPNLQHASSIKLNDDSLKNGDEVHLFVDSAYREKIMKNHSGTHLLNEALRVILGKHVFQQGSNVNDKGLRFDFNNFNSLSTDELLEIEKLVNAQIEANHNVDIREMPINEAKAMNVQAVFGEKYGDIVRVVNMDFSKELCGGTHVSNTKEIERFAILNFESKGSGIFRIEATTGDNIKPEIEIRIANIEAEIKELQQKTQDIYSNALNDGYKLEYNEIIISEFKESFETIINRKNELNLIKEQVKELDKAYNKFKRESTDLSLNDYYRKVESVNGYNVLVTKVENFDMDILKDLVDRLTENLDNSVVFIANVLEDKIVFVCKNKILTLQAGTLVKKAAIITNGNGGGRADFAQAGGKDKSKVDEALKETFALIGSML